MPLYPFETIGRQEEIDRPVSLLVEVCFDSLSFATDKFIQHGDIKKILLVVAEV